MGEGCDWASLLVTIPPPPPPPPQHLYRNNMVNGLPLIQLTALGKNLFLSLRFIISVIFFNELAGVSGNTELTRLARVVMHDVFIHHFSRARNVLGFAQSTPPHLPPLGKQNEHSPSLRPGLYVELYMSRT